MHNAGTKAQSALCTIWTWTASLLCAQGKHKCVASDLRLADVHGATLPFSAMLPLGATHCSATGGQAAACILHVKTSFYMSFTCNWCPLLLQLLSGPMLGSQEDWPGFPQLQGLRHPVGPSFDTADMSTSSIGRSLS